MTSKCSNCGNLKDRHPLREGFKCEKFIPEDDFCKCKTCGFPEYVEEGSVGRICECEKFIPIEMIPVVYSGEYIIKEKKDCEDDCRCVTGGHGGYVYCPIHSKKEKKDSEDDLKVHERLYESVMEEKKGCYDYMICYKCEKKFSKVLWELCPSCSTAATPEDDVCSCKNCTENRVFTFKNPKKCLKEKKGCEDELIINAKGQYVDGDCNNPKKRLYVKEKKGCEVKGCEVIE